MVAEVLNKMRCFGLKLYGIACFALLTRKFWVKTHFFSSAHFKWVFFSSNFAPFIFFRHDLIDNIFLFSFFSSECFYASGHHELYFLIIQLRNKFIRELKIIRKNNLTRRHTIWWKRNTTDIINSLK